MRIIIAILLSFILKSFAPAKDQPETPLPEVTANAIKLSRITAPGSPPFHLKAVVSEPGNRNSDYQGEIEEYWVNPDKWHRTVKTSNFSQTIIVNGDNVYEQTVGDYYPFWLRNIVTALIDLVPDDFSPKGNIQVRRPAETNERTVAFGTCSRWDEKVGVSPAQNSVFTMICFAGDERLITALFTPYFHAEFQSYSDFKHKRVARRIVEAPEPGTRIEARVTELSEVHKVEESLFAVPQPMPENTRVHSIRIRESDARKVLLNSPEITWAPVHDGRTSGVLSMMAYVDKAGNVRETWALNSDNPFPQAQARKEVLKWKFKPLERDGVPVQMEVLLTFPFQTAIVDPIPLFSDSEARKMATSKADPKFLQTSFPKGTDFTVRALVDERGHVVRVDNPKQLDPGLFNAAQSALSMWLFKPYKVNGTAQRFNADVTFYVR